MAAKRVEKKVERPLAHFQTADLEAELAHRETLRVEAENKKRDRAWWLLHVALRHSSTVTTPEEVVCLGAELLNLLAPTHNRLSCSDENPINGWYTEVQGAPSCTRCALIELKTIYNSGPVDCVPKFEILFSPVKKDERG